MSVRARTILTWANTRKQSSFTAPLQLYLVDALATAALAAAILVMSWRPARLSTYLVDFYCYRPPDRCASLRVLSLPLYRICPYQEACNYTSACNIYAMGSQAMHIRGFHRCFFGRATCPG